MRLRVKRAGGKWRVIDVAADDPYVSNAGSASAPRRSSEDVGFYFFGGRINEPDLLRKELAADALLHQPDLFSALGRAKRNCASGNCEEGFSVELPNPADTAKFRSIFERTCPTTFASYSPRLLLRFFCAALLALLALAWSIARHSGSSRAIVPNSTWIAAHAEWSNRSRHLLGVAAESGESLPLILLGRPRASLQDVSRLLSQHLPQARFQLLRPISLGAAAAAVPAVVSDLRSALRKLAGFGYAPPLNRLVPILYRLCLGRVHRCWWRQLKAQPERIVYAHTGNADTSALELEQQRSGSRTVHLLHGISTGHIFSGFSDLAITRCGHDARWHERLGGYAKVTHLAAGSELPAESAGWALFTNYAHPTAFSTEAAGVAYEVEVIATVAAAARRLRYGTEAVAYRPHPALGSLSRQARRMVEEAARDAGLAPWPNGRELTSAPGFELVMTTPSTIVQDALCAGSVPIVIDLVGVDADSVYGAYPFRASSQEQLAELVREVQAAPEQCFKKAWEAVQPGLMPDLKRIVQMAADLAKSSQPSEEAC